MYRESPDRFSRRFSIHVQQTKPWFVFKVYALIFSLIDPGQPLSLQGLVSVGYTIS